MNWGLETKALYKISKVYFKCRLCKAISVDYNNKYMELEKTRSNLNIILEPE